jgi:hypothetical protein
LAASEYNHLAGRLGVVLMAALLQDGVLDGEHRPGVGADRLAGPGRMTESNPRIQLGNTIRRHGGGRDLLFAGGWGDRG